MKATYQTPDIDVVEFEVSTKIMFNDGYADGDIIENPYGPSDF